MTDNKRELADALYAPAPWGLYDNTRHAWLAGYKAALIAAAEQEERADRVRAALVNRVQGMSSDSVAEVTTWELLEWIDKLSPADALTPPAEPAARVGGLRHPEPACNYQLGPVGGPGCICVPPSAVAVDEREGSGKGYVCGACRDTGFVSSPLTEQATRCPNCREQSSGALWTYDALLSQVDNSPAGVVVIADRPHEQEPLAVMRHSTFALRQAQPEGAAFYDTVKDIQRRMVEATVSYTAEGRGLNTPAAAHLKPFISELGSALALHTRPAEVSDEMVERMRTSLWSTWGKGRTTTDWPNDNNLRAALQAALVKPS